MFRMGGHRESIESNEYNLKQLFQPSKIFDNSFPYAHVFHSEEEAY